MRGSRLRPVCSSSTNVRTVGVGEVRPGVDIVSGPLEAVGPDELVHASNTRPLATTQSMKRIAEPPLTG
jgi:hypothetical protein